MPNYVRNIVKMEGIAELPLFTEEAGSRHFDFNKLNPMPSELDVEEGSRTDLAIIYFITERCAVPISELSEQRKQIVNKLLGNIHSSDWPEEVFRRATKWVLSSSEAEKDALYKLGHQYISNYEKYGATTWYKWCCQNWGTKWNACRTEIIDKDTIMFDTAWSNPAPILITLSELYPAVRIEHWWADEDVGSNTGHRILIDGDEHVEYYDGDRAAYDIYTKCWGECYCVYLDEYGMIHHRDCDGCDGCSHVD